MNFCVAKSILGVKDKTMKKTKSQLLDSIVGKETGERQWTRNESVPSGNKCYEEERKGESEIMEEDRGW